MLADLRQMVAALAPKAAVLGLDVGSKTIGIAVSDGRRIIASPVDTVHRGKFAADAKHLRSSADEYGAGGLVIGLPLGMDGREGPRCQSVRQFAKDLHGLLGLPYAFWDERLSTAAIQRLLVDVVQRQGGTASRQRQCTPGTDAATGSRDNHTFTLQIHRQFRHFLSPRNSVV